MASVDNRVVGMEFNNAAFEARVSTTIDSLDRLKKSLDFANSQRSLNEFEAAGKAFNLNGISAALEGISSKFNAVGAVAFSVLNNITTRAIDAGIRIAKALSLNQITDGLSDYELKVGATQTIMAGTGKNIDEVTAALKNLDIYADKTIYNLRDMVGNISKFTNAGVDLDVAQRAMVGIANVAAVSGASSEEAARAMYNLGQAIGQGTVRLMDWKSVELANMGTREFKQQLIDSAVEMGTLKRATDGTTTSLKGTKVTAENFSTTLDDAWLSAEALTTTLERYADQNTEIGKKAWAAAQNVKTFSMMTETLKASISTGWTDTFDILVGNLPEATELFTNITNSIGAIVGKSADSRNALLKDWKDLGGRATLIEAVTNVFKALGSVMSAVKKGFQQVFPPMTAARLFELTKSFKEFTEKLQLSQKGLDTIRMVVSGALDGFVILITILKEAAKWVGSLFQAFGKANGDSILSFIRLLAVNISILKENLVDSGAIANFFKNLSGNISEFVNSLKRFFESTEGFKQSLKILVAYFKTGFEGITNIDGEGIFKLANLLGNTIRKIGEYISGLFSGVDDATSGLQERVKTRFGFIAGIFSKIGDIFSYLADKVAPLWDGFVEKVVKSGFGLKKLSDFIKEHFSELPQKLSEIFSNVDYSDTLDTVNVGLFAGLLLLFRKFISGGGLFSALKEAAEKITGSVDTVAKSASKSLDSLSGTLQAMEANVKAEALMKIAGAVAILTASMVVLSLMNSEAITKSLVAMTVGFGQLVGVMLLLNKFVSGPMSAAKLDLLAVGLMGIAGAMLVLSLAMKILATMNWEELSKGIAGFAAIMGVLVVAVKLMEGSASGMTRIGFALLEIAVAMNILALAVKSFAEMSWQDMAKGMAAVAASLVIIGGAMNLFPSGMALKGAGLLEVSVALNILALAVKSFAEMNLKELATGMGAIAASMLILAGALHLMPNGVSMGLQGAGLIAIAIGLRLLTSTIKELGDMSWGELARGLAGIAGALIILAGAAFLMQGSLGGAVAIGIMAVSLTQLALGVKLFSQLSWGDLLKGLVGLAATFAVLALGGLILQPVVLVLVALGAALLLIGAAVFLFGAGANLLATAFALIATSGTQALDTLVTIIETLIKLLPKLIVAVGEAIIQLVAKLIEALPGIIKDLSKVITALLDLVIANIPKLAEVLVTLVLEGLKALKETFPQVLLVGFEMLLKLLQGIRDNMQEITNVVIDIVLNFLNTMKSRMPEIVKSGLELLTAFLKGIADHLEDVIKAVGEVVAAFIRGVGNLAKDIVTAGTDALVSFLQGIRDAIPKVAAAITEVITAFLTAISHETPRVVDAFFQMFIDLFNGIASVLRARSGELGRAMGNMVSAMVAGMGNAIKEAMKEIIDNMFPGIGGKVVGALYDLFGINSPSRVTYYIGEMLMAGLSLGVTDSVGGAQRTLEESGALMVNTVGSTMAKVSEALNTNIDFNPTITPVLDLTNVEQGARKLSTLIKPAPGLSATVSLGRAQSIAIDTSLAADAASTIAPSGPTSVTFNQNNYSPEALSTAAIYRQTRNQIAMAKEELAVL